MSELTPVNTSTPSYELLDTDPTVSVNISMKDTLSEDEEYHIDYNALRTTLHGVNAPADNSKLSIEFGSALPKSVGGMYRPEIQSIKLKHLPKSKKAQRVLQHELKHYVDMTENPITQADLTKNIIGQVSLNTFSASAIVTAGASSVETAVKLINKFKYNFTSDALETAANSYDTIQHISGPVTLGALALSGFYFFHNRELTARKAEKIDLPTVISKRQISTP